MEGLPELVVSLASNDYLGLTGHPALAEAAARAANDLGTGAGASRLVTGNFDIHTRLEEALSEVMGAERVCLFGSGYLANQGVIQALMEGAGDIIYSDQLNHASIVDGCKLARAKVRTFRHLDTGHLEQQLAQDAGSGSRGLIVTESIFSMDGDEAPLARICELAERFNAWVMVDEAHAFGVRGGGGGLARELDLAGRIHARVGTLGKAAGSYGAFVAGSAALAEYLINRSRSLIYSTALPPTVAAASLAAVKIIGSAEGDQLRRDLHLAGSQLRAGLAGRGWRVGQGSGIIIPLMVNDPFRAVALSEDLLGRGVLARAMRYPTVPRGGERLRLVASAAHQEEHIRRALEAFGDATN